MADRPHAAGTGAARHASTSAGTPRDRATGSASWPACCDGRASCLLTLSYSLQGYVGYIFVFWFYIYLVQVRHFDLLQGAVVSSLSWVFTTVAIPLGGIVSDWLVRGRLGPVWGRRLVPMIGMGGSGVLHRHRRAHGRSLSGGRVAGRRHVARPVRGRPVLVDDGRLAGERSGTGGGIMNTGCNVAGLLSPIVTPWLGAADRLGAGAARRRRARRSSPRCCGSGLTRA